LYLDLVAAAMEDMKNTAVVSTVVSMESTIKILPGSIKFELS
jgi:hypothetical protein